MLGRIALAVAAVWVARRWRSHKALVEPSARKQRLQDQELRWEGEGGATPTGPQVLAEADAANKGTA